MKTLILPEELFRMRPYVDSYILQNVHFEQNPQGRSSQSKSQSHSGKVGCLTRINCLEPIVLELLVENNMFVYSELLCKYHGNSQRYYAWWKKNANSLRNRERQGM